MNSAFYMTQIDNIKIIALSCGDLLEDGWLRGIDKERYDKLLLAEGITKENGGVRTSNTSFLIDDGKRIFLIDAGSNYDGKPETLANQLKKAGYDPTQISAILLTHLHDDHYLGLHDREGKPIFRNATLYFSNQSGRTQFKGYPTKTFATGAVLLKAVQTVDLPGHYYGHTGYSIVSEKGREILFWGDVVQNYAIQLPQPDVYGIFDTSPQIGNQTRKAILAKVAEKKTLIGGSHMPFPSLGYINKIDQQYEWESL